MSDRVFRVDFYPQDWIADTSQLEMDERSIFIQVVALIYCQRGAIENDPKWIANISRCSTKLAKSLIQKLIHKGFLQLTEAGKLTQKRAENELKSKREHLQNSSKGGSENALRNHQSNKNNDLDSSSTPPHPPVGKNTPLPPAARSSQNGTQRGGGFKKIGDGLVGGSGIRFDIEPQLTDYERREMLAILPNWDRNRLVERYNAWIASTGDIPRSPRAAFVGWMKKQPKNP